MGWGFPPCGRRWVKVHGNLGVGAIIAFNIIQPGADSDFAELMQGAETTTMIVSGADKGLAETMWDQVFNLIPSNPFAALADPTNKSILGVIFFALMFGVFTCVVGGEVGANLTKLFNGAYEVMMRMTMFIIKFAPAGIS